MSTPEPTPDLREAIIAAATRLFAEQGYSATSVRQLVAASGCAKPALYYYFGSKEALFRETVQRHLDDMNRMVREHLRSPGPVRACVHRAVSAFLDYAIGNPHVFRLLQRIETQPEKEAPAFNMMATRELHLSLLGDLMQQGVDSGELRPGIDPFDGALVVAATMSYQCELAVVSDAWDRDRIHRTIDLVFDGIAP